MLKQEETIMIFETNFNHPGMSDCKITGRAFITACNNFNYKNHYSDLLQYILYFWR